LAVDLRKGGAAVNAKTTRGSFAVNGLVLLAGVGIGLVAALLIWPRSVPVTESPEPSGTPSAVADASPPPEPPAETGFQGEGGQSGGAAPADGVQAPVAESPGQPAATESPAAAPSSSVGPSPGAVLVELAGDPQSPPEARVSPALRSAAGVVPPARLSGVPLPEALAKLAGAPRALLPGEAAAVVVVGHAVVVADAADARALHILSGHSSNVSGATVSPDGKQLVTSSYDDTVRLWDLGTGKELRRLASASTDFEAVAFSPDGTKVAAVNDDKHLWLASVAGGEPKKAPAKTANYQHGVAFAPNGVMIATIGGGALILWDAQTLEQRVKADTAENRVLFSPGGDLLATYGDSRTIRLRAPADARVIRELGEPTQNTAAVAWSPSGQYLVATASQNSEALVYAAATGAVVLRLPHRSHVVWAAFSADGRRVYTYADGLWAWDMTVLEDSEKRRAFLAWFDGQKDHYARFIRMFVVDPAAASRLVPHSEPWGGRLFVRVTNSQGLAFDSAELKLGNSTLQPTIAVKVGAADVSVETKKLRSLEVLGVDGKTARLKLTLLDGTTVAATRDTGTVTGSCAVGEFAYDLADLAQLSFNSRRLEEAFDEPTAPGDMPCEAAVVDARGTRLEATDVRTGGSNQAHELIFYVDNGRFKTSLRLVRAIDVVATPRGGVIARLSFIGNVRLFGFIGDSDVARLSGSLGLAQFTLGLEELRAIHFR
jgi:DNA-binding beta-propeller fold protein YncE